MKACISKFDGDKEYYFEEGCFITELSNSPDDPEVSIARARVEPGKTTRWHRLRDTVERYVIVQGSGLVDVGELAAEQVGVGDTVIIPCGCKQRISNTGLNDLVFLAICSPPFRAAIYEDVDN